MASFIPAAKTIRLSIGFSDTDGHVASCHYFQTYSGSAPTAANLVVFAGGAGGACTSELAVNLHSSWTIENVIATDLTSETAAQGTSIVGTPGALTGARLPGSTAMVVSRQTTRRYRGGHSRVYIPWGDATKLLNDAQWTTSTVTDAQGTWADIESASAAGVWSGGGTITSVAASFYSGFHYETYGTPPKQRRVSDGRSTALLDPVLTFIGKQNVGTQRRRIRP